MKMISIVFLLLLAIVSVVGSDESQPLLPASCNKPLGLRRALKDHTMQLQMLGGDDVTEKFDKMFESIEKVREIEELRVEATKLFEDTQKQSKSFITVFGSDKYSNYLKKLSKNIMDVSKVTKKLLSLTHKIYVNVGYIGQQIESIGYNLEVQKDFGNFLQEGVNLAEDLIQDLENLITKFRNQRMEAHTDKEFAKQWKKDRKTEQDNATDKANQKYWWCFTGIGCAFVAIQVELIDKKAIDAAFEAIMEDQERVMDALNRAEPITFEVLDQVCIWEPQVSKLKKGIDATIKQNKRVLPALRKKFYQDHPERAGVLNGYTIFLMESMRALQKKCEAVDGFSEKFVGDLKGYKVRIPKEKIDTSDICLCVQLGVGNSWVDSDTNAGPDSKCNNAVGKLDEDMELVRKLDLDSCSRYFTRGTTEEHKECQQRIIDYAMNEKECSALPLKPNVDYGPTKPALTEPAEYCSKGVSRENVCCAASCGICGGTGCSKRNGGYSKCCMGGIRSLNRKCENGQDTTCVIPSHWELIAQGWIPSYEHKIPEEWKTRGQFITENVQKSLPEGYSKIQLECKGLQSHVVDVRETSSGVEEGGSTLTEWHRYGSNYHRFILRFNQIHCNLDYAALENKQTDNPNLGQWGRVWVWTTGHLRKTTGPNTITLEDKHHEECWNNLGCKDDGASVCAACGEHDGKDMYCCNKNRRYPSGHACHNSIFGTIAGHHCVTANRSSKDNKPKAPKSCEVNWSEWSACSKTCKGGLRSRTITEITQQPENGGYACPESPAYKSCNREVKCPCKEKLSEMENSVVKNPLDEKMYFIAKGKRYLLSCKTKAKSPGEEESDSKRNLCAENIALEDECIEHPEWPFGGEYKEGIHAEPKVFCSKGRQNDINMGIEAAYAMKLAYDIEANTVKIKKGDILEFGWKVLENYSGNEQGGWRALVWEKDDTCLVSFKGTTGDFGGNWAQANLIAEPFRVENVNVHTGFYFMAGFASKKLKGQFGAGKHCSGKKVVVTGHSLGAAVAEIFSWALLRGLFDLKKRSKDDVTTITFAQPQTFLKTTRKIFWFGDWTDRDCPSEIHNNPRSYRIVLSSMQGGKTVWDPLPRIQLPTLQQFVTGTFILAPNPFFQYSFKHCNKGTEIRIDHTESVGQQMYKRHDEENWPTGKGDFQFLYADTNALELLQTTGTEQKLFSLHMQHVYKRAMDANGYEGTCKTNYN